MSDLASDLWKEFLTGRDGFEKGDSAAFETTRLNAVELLTHKKRPAGMGPLTPGNLSLPAAWLARYSPACAVPATLILLNRSPSSASMAVADVVRILGSDALPLLEDMDGKSVGYPSLILAVGAVLVTERGSEELSQMGDRLLDRLVKNINPQYGTSILELVAKSGCGIRLDLLENLRTGEDPALACIAAELTRGFLDNGNVGGVESWRRFEFGLPISAFTGMPWKPEWDPLREWMEATAAKCVRMQSQSTSSPSSSSTTFLGGCPGLAEGNAWPVSAADRPLIFAGRLGRDIFTLCGYPVTEAQDLWFDAEGQMEEGILWGCGLEAIVRDCSADAVDGHSDSTSCTFSKVHVAVETCLDIPRGRRMGNGDANKEMDNWAYQFTKLTDGKTWQIEGGLHQAFGHGSSQEEGGENLLRLVGDPLLGLGFPDTGSLSFRLRKGALSAGNLKNATAFVEYC